MALKHQNWPTSVISAVLAIGFVHSKGPHGLLQAKELDVFGYSSAEASLPRTELISWRACELRWKIDPH
jgi:hypothetical protein